MACRAAAAFWVRAEADRKHPLRLARHFGVWASLRFAARRLSLERALALAGQRMGLRVSAVRIPIAEAAIDVDTPEDLALAERILRGRAG